MFGIRPFIHGQRSGYAGDPCGCPGVGLSGICGLGAPRLSPAVLAVLLGLSPVASAQASGCRPLNADTTAGARRPVDDGCQTLMDQRLERAEVVVAPSWEDLYQAAIFSARYSIKI